MNTWETLRGPVTSIPRSSSSLTPTPPRKKSWARRLLHRVFYDIPVNPEAAERLERAYAEGVVVHVMRSSSLLAPLYADYALDRFGLPSFSWRPDADKPTEALKDSLRTGGAALLFLERPVTLGNPRRSYPEDFVQTLIELQPELDRPIFLVPEVLLSESKAELSPSLRDTAFGRAETPGRLRELLGFVIHYRRTRFHIGAPIDLSAVIEREAPRSTAGISRSLRFALRRELQREQELQTGPKHRDASRARRRVLRDAGVQRFIAAHSKTKEERRALLRKADAILRTTAADLRFGWFRYLDALIDFIWHRIYDGIVVDREGLAGVREAARKSPIVLVPSHKSHIDYLVLSQVFYKEGLMPPHIAAGDNLNFPPLGFIFRRAGAFFLRRSFKGDKLYTAVFAAYLRRLLKDRFPIEFFIEGGRSRTGKLLAPRMGLLSMCADPVLDGQLADVTFVPVAISYEKLIEAKAYAHELKGGEKRKEDVGALLSTRKVLRSRYGRVYVDFEEPVSVRVFAAARGYPLAQEASAPPLDKQERRQLILRLGHRIVYGINAGTRVTPISVAAMIFLSSPRRGMSAEHLFLRADQVLDYLDHIQARCSRVLAPDTRQTALREALGRFTQDGLITELEAPDGGVVYQVSDEGRQALDYYKNNILHFFLPVSILATAAISLNIAEGAQFGLEALQERALHVSRLLKNDFSFRQDRPLEDNLHEALALLIDRGFLSEESTAEGRRYAINNNKDLGVIASLLSVFFESYRLTAMGVAKLPPTADAKEAVQALLNRAKKLLLEGRVERAEAVSQPLVKTGLLVLADRKIIGSAADPEVIDEPARLSLIQELNACIPPAIAP